MTTFETETDLIREKKAIELFVSIFGGSFKKLDPQDIDYKVFDKDKSLIAYAEVKGRIRTMRAAYPLPISAKKLVKLIEALPDKFDIHLVPFNTGANKHENDDLLNKKIFRHFFCKYNTY